MAKYITKVIEIEAIQFKRHNWEDVVNFTNNDVYNLMIERRINGIAKCMLKNNFFTYEVTEGDYIVRHSMTGCHHITKSNFEMQYDPC